MVYNKLCLHRSDEILQIFVDCKHCFLNSVKESLFISPKILLHLFLINMVTETKLAI